MSSNFIHLIIGPILSLLAFIFANQYGLSEAITHTLWVTVLTAYWWITEALPIPFTSLIPFVLFPAAGVLDHKQAASSLGSHVIVLLMGAFMLGKAIEVSNVHQRIAFNLINRIGGGSAQKIIFAIMVSAAVLSMWISNTATVVALLPVVLALCASTDNNRFKIGLLLGLAYSASIGGMGTIIGTPPNIIFASVYEQFAGKEYSFVAWMKVGVPIVILSIPLAALWLARGIKLEQEITLPAMNTWTIAEKRVLMVFALVAVAWVFRKEPFGGWSTLFAMPNAGDSTVALLGVALMALIPNGKGEKLLTWKQAQSIPWGMLLLFAGGICIAKAFISSGLSQMLGDYLISFGTLPLLLMLFLMCISVSFLTEITSNTATATLLMPIIASGAIALSLPIELLMIPVVISCSCAFCLPVATAPNSIVFSSGEIQVKEMVREGVMLNIIVAAIISMVCYLLLVK